MTWVPSTFLPPISVRLEKSSLKCHRKTDLGVADQRDLPRLNVCWVERSSSIISRHNVHSQQLNLKRINNYIPLQPTQTHTNPSEHMPTHPNTYQSTWTYCIPSPHTSLHLNTLHPTQTYSNPSEHTAVHLPTPIQMNTGPSTHPHTSPPDPTLIQTLLCIPSTLPSILTRRTHQTKHICPIQLKHTSIHPNTTPPPPNKTQPQHVSPPPPPQARAHLFPQRVGEDLGGVLQESLALLTLLRPVGAPDDAVVLTRPAGLLVQLQQRGHAGHRSGSNKGFVSVFQQMFFVNALVVLAGTVLPPVKKGWVIPYAPPTKII